jgi:hypothetical protein
MTLGYHGAARGLLSCKRDRFHQLRNLRDLVAYIRAEWLARLIVGLQRYFHQLFARLGLGEYFLRRVNNSPLMCDEAAMPSDA